MINQLVDVTDSRWQQVFDIWLSANTEAHSFIDASYWEEALPFVKKMMPEALVYVFEEEDTVLGFIGMGDDYIEGIFVKNESQGTGVGKRLLNFVKERHTHLTLSVYEENKKAYEFYIKQGFTFLSESIDETGHLEKTLTWNN